MASNFDFLSNNWSFLYDEAGEVEKNALRVPRTSAFYARRTMELAVKWLYENDSYLRLPYKNNLAALIHEQTFKENLPPGLFQDIRYIWKLGNLAAHADQTVSSGEGAKVCSALHSFVGWIVRVYSEDGIEPEPFNIALLPKAGNRAKKESKAQAQKVAAELQKTREQLEKKEQAQAEAKAKQERTEEELNRVKERLAELQALKKKNKQKIPPSRYSEAQTRDAFIDVMLREAGWDPHGENVAEYKVRGMPSESGVGKVDYVLWGADGLPLAVVEAKRTKKDAEEGQQQAALYADCLEMDFKQRPLIFYTNGYSAWLWDDTEYPPREVEGFYNRDELQWTINRRGGKKDLTKLKPKKEVAGRHYQIEAAARVMETFQTQKRRKALIVMATGTGKTRLAMSIVDLLMSGGWARRILFLADRIALVKQAKREFNKNLPHVSVASLPDKKREEARVVFSTYPTILNLIDGTRKEPTDSFSVGHFDLIIIDEAHRSVYQKYGAIFDYFDSLLLGLTATPRDQVDRNTYKLFELQDHQPTFSYELDQAVKDGFLVPPRAISVPMKFQREGVKYGELSLEEQEEYELQERFYDEEGELKEEIGSAALNSWLFNEDTVDKVLMHLLENGLKVEGGDKLGKTIVFAKNKNHAKFIVERFDFNYPHLVGKFCRRIDHSVNYSQDLIDDFSLKNKDPQIAVSVDMLDTGIDAPEVLNLVFFKLVRSKTKFWQMVGRGTRLCEDLLGPGKDKTDFLIFDYCRNLEFFDANPDGYDAPVRDSVKKKIFKRRLEIAVALQNAERKKEAPLSRILKDQLRGRIAGLNVHNFIVRKERETVEFFSKAENWDHLAQKDIEKIEGKLSGLPSANLDHETARRFDLLILNLQAAILKGSNRQEFYRKAVTEIAVDLEDKKTIPIVAAQMETILEIQTGGWWEDVTLSMLEETRLKLRDLAIFVDHKPQTEYVYTDFGDDLLADEAATYDIVGPDPKMKDYRSRVERYIRENRDHITIRRLRNNEPVTQKDIQALEDLLFDKERIVPREEYESVYSGKPLGVLVRSVVGLSRNAAKRAFAEFLEKAPLHPDQISFLNEVVEFLVKNGVMEPEELFEAPFTHFHETGLTGVMGDRLAKEVVELVREINSNAKVA